MKLNIIKNKVKLVKKKVAYKNVVFATQFTALTYLLFSVTAYAATPTIDDLGKLISNWAQKGGGVIAFIGAIDAIMGYRNEDPSERIRGIRTCVAGLGVAAVALAYTTWM